MTYRGFAGIARMRASFNVKCDAGYYGPDCTNRCQDFRNCADCGLTGFTGEFCQFPIDHCNGVTCSGNGQCQNSPSGFTCVCNQGYTGQTCETVIGNSGINANAGGNAGGIAGGVVGGLVGVALVFLLIVILLLVITKTRKQKTNSLNRNESGRNVIGPGDNPVYDIGNEQQVITEGGNEQQVMTEGGNNLTQHENGGISENCEERDFDNPLYSSGPLEDGGYYAVPESSTPPPPLHESVVNENPEPVDYEYLREGDSQGRRERQ